MKKLYDESISKMQPEEEVRARHILVKSEQEAKDILAKLKGGADFEKLARELSIDPSAKTNGGDLEYFGKGQMVAEFAEAAFKLNKGQVSEPVKTQFGFHIIKVEDKRTKPVPAYDAVKEQVAAFVVRKAQAELVMKLRQDAKIENLVKKDAPPTPPAKNEQKKKK
jgi:peptidyl-prolyl cis-trans isomerase C